MKEYIAESGGRYTYTDDILNLQELSLSMTAIFEDCSNFIVSGCLINGFDISSGYVWINNKIRYFEGSKGATFPYYIYEKNISDATTYANDVNKRGRCNYLCEGGKVVPTENDMVTGMVASFIELKKEYSPRFIDKFMGKYAVLLETPFARQTILKDLLLEGNLSVNKCLESKTSVSVVNDANSFSLKQLVKENGDISIGAYLNSALVSEIIINANGTFSFIKAGKELAKVSQEGLTFANSHTNTSQTGSVYIYDSHVVNTLSESDEGAININHKGLILGSSKFRNLNVYNGKQASVPIFQVVGKSDIVNVTGLLNIRNAGNGFVLSNTTFLKGDKRLINLLSWTDSNNEPIATIGYATNESFDFNLTNTLGNIIISPKTYVDITGELRINGKDISTIYVNQTNFTTELNKKVNIVQGKQLSTEDFSTANRNKLDSIFKGSIATISEGYVTINEATEALNKKMNSLGNLSDLPNKGTARTNLDVFSKGEANSIFLKISSNLLELISLTAEEVNGLTPQQASALKVQRQTAVRDNLDTEKKGIGDLKLAKASNLSDLPDKVLSRKNISVYSTTEVNTFLAGKLSVNSAYTGAIFTPDHKTKLEAIKTGVFVGTDNEGKPIAQVEGYTMTSAIIKELAKKANLLLDGYNATQKDSVAANINVYTKAGADNKFASIDSLFQDYITLLVKQGKNTTEAQQILRNKLNVPSKEDVSNNYIKKDGKLSDLILANAEAKKLACRTIGAAYADEYQAKLVDTGWLQMQNSGSGTDTRRLFIRQVGNVVCIQGVINTGKRDGSNWGGTVAIIPNQISPPKYGLRTTLCDFNDDHKYNRGSSFVLSGNSRNILLYESGWNNIDTEINFTYMV
ncbi:hypothetical protein [Dysgonomonas sp. GY617]|uniref:hypothetical protein n=1 Tax=Dysgonomonas sp. GY617 TaxID=2780420 RepID=UPI00188425FD|nr:hypothetical protein [Dysgonomonas sp. GY617]MBF0575540.1 hypothetical protein [Dysgonomonas sp. GY617]